MQSREG
nr:unnamed protein product [Callosobruchus chinensis]CAH7732391.1 unnamed protein product [Callosobruchus chinensis]CAH7752945.1 unnamed protein product [Callosobruchus chinensis]CAH7753224.1 unnamed protein product [Callosobruchus chinensis]CAH7756520.1 unnamed protein product [Callosobruchus chinensis]